MPKGYQNKQIKVDNTIEDSDATAYFFPAYSISIRASSKQEALDKLEEHIKSLSSSK